MLILFSLNASDSTATPPSLSSHYRHHPYGSGEDVFCTPYTPPPPPLGTSIILPITTFPSQDERLQREIRPLQAAFPTQSIPTTPDSSSSVGNSPSSSTTSPPKPQPIRWDHLGYVPAVRSIDPKILGGDYEGALSLINAELQQKPEAFPLLIRKMACTFMLQNYAELSATYTYLLTIATDPKYYWAREWALFFEACSPLLQGQPISLLKMQDAFEVTKDPAVRIFVLKALAQHSIPTKKAIERRYAVTLEDLLHKYTKSPILPFPFADQMLRRFTTLRSSERARNS